MQIYVLAQTKKDFKNLISLKSFDKNIPICLQISYMEEIIIPWIKSNTLNKNKKCSFLIKR